MAGELLGRKRALSEAIAEASVELRRVKRSVADAAARRRRRGDTEWVLSGTLLDTTLAVYALADFNPEAAVVHLKGAGRQRWPWAPKTDAELIAIVEAAFLNADLGELAALCEHNHPAGNEVLRAAAACVAQWRSVVWTRACGVHPDTAAIATEYEAVRQIFDEGVRPPLWLGCRGARKRGTRLRRRWGGRFGVSRPREILPATEMLDKVARGAIGAVSRSTDGSPNVLFPWHVLLVGMRTSASRVVTHPIDS
jgi:hypothetical protein